MDFDKPKLFDEKDDPLKASGMYVAEYPQTIEQALLTLYKTATTGAKISTKELQKILDSDKMPIKDKKNADQIGEEVNLQVEAEKKQSGFFSHSGIRQSGIAIARFIKIANSTIKDPNPPVLFNWTVGNKFAIEFTKSATPTPEICDCLRRFFIAGIWETAVENNLINSSKNVPSQYAESGKQFFKKFDVRKVSRSVEKTLAQGGRIVLRNTENLQYTPPATNFKLLISDPVKPCLYGYMRAYKDGRMMPFFTGGSNAGFVNP